MSTALKEVKARLYDKYGHGDEKAISHGIEERYLRAKAKNETSQNVNTSE
jgi:hypothetical protein